MRVAGLELGWAERVFESARGWGWARADLRRLPGQQVENLRLNRLSHLESGAEVDATGVGGVRVVFARAGEAGTALDMPHADSRVEARIRAHEALASTFRDAALAVGHNPPAPFLPSVSAASGASARLRGRRGRG